MPTVKQLFVPHRLIPFLNLLFLASLLSGCQLFGGSEPNQAEAEVEQTTAAAGQPEAGGVVDVAQTGPTVSVLPATQRIGVNETVVVEIRAANITDLFAADIQLRFDPAILQVQDADPNKDGVQVQPGNFPSPDFVATNEVDTATGLINYVFTQLTSGPVSGSGLLFSVTFQGIAQGVSNLNLENVQLITPDVEPMPVTPVGSSLTVGSGDLPTPTFTAVIPPTDTPVAPTNTPITPPTNTPVSATNTPIAQVTPTPVAGSPTATPLATPIPAPISNRYVVQRGDTLFSIARRYGLSVWPRLATDFREVVHT